ncbi:AAA family ATPase [Bacillus paralicheniformis]|uniref:ParA family protein n=1 Tax=Bacillus paralicheniformis TaxID=1648923 RepID=UPI0013EF1A66|nr:AAA family ATPase [Bacillus paralicheniformis]QII51315.1 AAA family ATPase [Bacillus paralicheniformis]
MEVISFINYKGGVGKTTLTSNIAAELAYRGIRVLLVDLDPQSNLTFSFINVDEWTELDKSSRTIKHWYDEFLNGDRDVSLQNLIVSPDNVNHKLKQMKADGILDLISSHLELINLDMELATQYGGNTERTFRSSFLRLFTRLKRGLDEVRDKYDVVLIDCPPNFNIVTQNAIIASDLYIVPAKADFLSTLGIDTLVRHIDSLTNRYNNYVKEDHGNWSLINPKLTGIIFNMINIYNSQPIQNQQRYISQVRRAYDNRVFDSYVRNNNTLFAPSPEAGVPVALNTEVEGVYLDIRSEIEDLVSELLNNTRISVWEESNE